MRERPDRALEYLGKRLRLLREGSGVSREVAGDRIGGSEPKISRIELGRTRVKEADLITLLHLYDALDSSEQQALMDLNRKIIEPQWWDEYARSTPGWFTSFLILESAAETVRTYESRFIPGLLQTPAYARALISLHFQGDEHQRQVDKRVRMRIRRRQSILGPLRVPGGGLSLKKPPLWAVIDESALQEKIGSPEIMREQIEFLIKSARTMNGRIQILPTGTGGLTGLGNSFSLFRFPSAILPDVVYLEHLTGAIFLEDQRDIDLYRAAMDRLGITALPPGDTITELEKARRRMWRT